MYPETSYSSTPTPFAAPPANRWKVWLGLLILLVVALIVGFLVAYTTIVPSRQVRRYINDVKTNQPALSAKMEKLSTAVLNSESLTSPTTDPDQTDKDVQTGRSALKAAQTTLDTTKKQISDFSPLPLSSWNDRYKSAEALRTDEKQYIAKSESYIKDMTEVVNFLDETAKIGKTVTASQGNANGSLLEQLSDLPAYGKKLDDALKQVEPAFDSYQKLKVPPALKDVYDFDVFTTKSTIENLKKQAAAAQAGDVSGFYSAALDQFAADLDNANAFEEKIKDFDNNSSLKKTDTALHDLNERIASEIKKF